MRLEENVVAALIELASDQVRRSTATA